MARIGRAAKPPKARRPLGTTTPVPIPSQHQTPHEEVFNTSPTVALYAKREGESQPAEAIECELFMLPEQYSLSGIYPDQDGVRLEAADQESADVLLRHLRASGWAVTASPIWPRYSFASLPSLSNRFTPEQIVAGLIMRNPELQPGALRFAGSRLREAPRNKRPPKRS